MDYNNLASRLERIYSSIDCRKDGEIQKYIHFKLIENPDNNIQSVVITFKKDQNTIEATNIILAVVEKLAHLKDHLKAKLGQQQNLVEELINDSLELQLIIDLANAEKHGYPLKRPERSNRSPQLHKIRTPLVIPPQETFGISLKTGKVVWPGNCRIEANADVVDGSCDFIFAWSDMVERAIKEWEDFINKHEIN